MTSIDDPRVQFYLRHQKLIEEWAAVRSDAAEAAHRFYLSLHDDIEQLSAELDDAEATIQDGSWSQVWLCRPSWKAADGVLRVMIGLEWRRGEATFVDGSRSVGVRVETPLPGGRDLRRRVGDEIRHLRTNAGFPDSSSYWAARTHPSPAGQYWDDIDSYRETLVELIADAWSTFAPGIDEAVRSG